MHGIYGKIGCKKKNGLGGAEVHQRGTPGVVEHQHASNKGREGVLTQIQRDVVDY
jgi:hypothetical protein